MSTEHSNDAEQGLADNTASEVDAQLPSPVRESNAESGIIINIDQVQSIDISDRFTKEKTVNGWFITVHSKVKVVVNLTTSMRKIEIILIKGDVIERDATDLIILRKHPHEAYKAQKSSSSLALTRNELLQSGTTGDTTV